MTEPGTDERALIQRAAAGGRARDEVVGELFARHEEAVVDYLVRILRDAALAEDALQETFLVLGEKLERYDPARPFRPWLLQVARNHGLMAVRRRGRQDAAARRAPPRTGPSPSDQLKKVSAHEAEGDARAALAALDDETRALLVERHGLGLKLEEMAVARDVTERTVRNRLQAAADTFARALLAGRRGGPS